MRYEWGEYAFDAAVSIQCSGADVVRWLVTPDLMRRWIVGLEGITPLDSRPDVVGARTSMYFLGQRGVRRTFLGEVVELSDQILVRCYRSDLDVDKWQQTVRYDMSASGTTTTVRCSVHTRLFSLPAVLKRVPRPHQLTHLQRSLERLRSLAEGRQLSRMRRIYESWQLSQPL